MSVARYGEAFERRVDPRGRNYYWASNDPPPPPSAKDSDVTALAEGVITVTYDSNMILQTALSLMS